MITRRTLLKTLGAATAFVFVTGFKACSEDDRVRRAMAALRALSPLVVAFHLASAIQERILQGIAEAINAFDVFVANPTRTHLRNAIGVLQNLIERGVFDTGNPTIDSRLGPAIALVLFVMETINPPSAPNELGLDGSATVVVTDAQEKVIDEKLDEFDEHVKALKKLAKDGGK